MRKTIALMKTSIKGFLRNWKSIVLLVLLPLLLVSSIFLSFNPNGIQKIPVGFIADVGETEIEQFKSAVDYFLLIEDFESLDSCMRELEKGEQYVCLDILIGRNIQLDVHFDNTREPIIWEVVERIKNTVDFIQKEKTKEIAENVLSGFDTAVRSSEDVKNELVNIRGDLYDFKQETQSKISTVSDYTNDIGNLADDIENSLDDAEGDIRGAEVNFYPIYEELDDISSGVDDLEEIVPAEGSAPLSSISSSVYATENMLENIEDNVNNELDSAASIVRSTKNSASSVSNYVSSIELEVSRLNTATSTIDDFISQIASLEKSLDSTGESFKEVSNLDADLLVNPVSIINYPTYIPQVDITIEDVETEEGGMFSVFAKGINLIGLQTIFPSILILIILFLALLIGAFMCLNEINSSADTRVKLVRGVFFSHFISIYFSSIIIIMIPVFSILWLGETLFQLRIFSNITEVFAIVFLLVSTFVFLGMTIAYIIKKESSTLLVSTFILVFLIFFSGFILPIERMSDLPNVLAINSPTNIAIRAFDKIVFYDLGNVSIDGNLLYLGAWAIAFFLIALTTKWIRD